MTTTVSRRAWLTGALGLATVACASRRSAMPGSRAPAASGAKLQIDTVTGPISADALGVTLMHEHVLVDFIGASEVSRSRYDADAVVTTVLPYLQQVRALGCETIVECTPAYLGRDARLLQRLSQASGLTILSNTGFYGAAKDKHVPRSPSPRPRSSWPRTGFVRPHAASTTRDQTGVHEDRRR